MLTLPEEEIGADLAAAGDHGGLPVWELALAAGSLLPGLVNAVVAVAPMNTVCQGFSMNKGISLMPGSTWMFHGEEIPYTSFGLDRFPLGRVLQESIRVRGDNDV